jgi:hypothetical protein
MHVNKHPVLTWFMNMTCKNTILATCLALATAPTAALAGIDVDSNLDDWIHAPTGSSSDWSNTLDAGTIFTFEDDTGGANSYLDPGWGGQPYDAEAIYVRRTSTTLDIAIVTGRAPGASGWAAGDIAIDFGNDRTFEYGIVTLSDSTGIGNQGELFSVTEWGYGLWEAPGHDGPAMTGFKTDHPTVVKTGTLKGTVALSYGAMTYGPTDTAGLAIGEHGDAGRHYVIEASIDAALLPELSSEGFLVHWTMACANDIAEVATLTVLPPDDQSVTGVPVPAPLALLLAGMAAIGGRRVLRRS